MHARCDLHVTMHQPDSTQHAVQLEQLFMHHGGKMKERRNILLEDAPTWLERPVARPLLDSKLCLRRQRQTSLGACAARHLDRTVMAKRLIPLLDRVLIEKVVAPSKSVGGVLLPESAVNKINQGTVVAVGPGRRTTSGEVVPVSVKEGDKVLLPEYGGTQIKLQEKEMFIYRDDELLGILTE